ncbi:MAG: tetratricopeptide repeat protein [Verrucomicrobiota bacterium]|jgi:tetratricopeptide (TPR) repeat protein
MSRFNNLEFGDHSHGDEQTSRIVKDDAYYLKEARTAFEQGRFERALRSFAKVLEFDPKCTAAWAGQVRMLIELEQFHEAKLWADKALEHFPDEPELLAVKAVALARSGDLKAALVFSDNAIQASGDVPYVWLARGDVLLARKEKLADYCFEKAFALAPGDWVVHWLAARICRFYRQFARALKLAQEALNLNSAQAVLWLEVGRAQQALGLVGHAENSFVQARQLDPSCAVAADLEIESGFWTRLRGRWQRLIGP